MRRIDCALAAQTAWKRPLPHSCPVTLAAGSHRPIFSRRRDREGERCGCGLARGQTSWHGPWWKPARRHPVSFHSFATLLSVLPQSQPPQAHPDGNQDHGRDENAKNDFHAAPDSIASLTIAALIRYSKRI